MKLAFTTLGCPNWSLEQAIDAALRYGYAGLELRLLDGEILQPTIDSAARKRVRDALAAAGLALVCVDTSVRIAQPDPDARAAQIRDGLAFLELAAEWGAPSIRVFGSPPAGTSQQDAITGAVACLAPLAERGQALGVTVALETHDALSTAVTVAQVVGHMPVQGAGVIWDILHPLRNGEPVEQTLALLGDRLSHVHIKDGRRPADGGDAWELTLLGEGDVPVPQILAALKARNYAGWLAVEWEKKWHPELADPEIALPQHAEQLRAMLAAI